jgi:hypothetical protein
VRTLSQREKGLLVLVAVAASALVVQRLNNHAGTPSARSRTEPLPPPVERIDLARLSAEHPDRGAGKRDLFRFGSAAPVDDSADAPPIEAPAYTPAPPRPLDPGSAVASLPPLNLKYLGSVESRAGVKVAVLLTDRKEVLTGQAGETVANRYRIARIGLESLDLEDMASGQSRRLPLRGN